MTLRALGSGPLRTNESILWSHLASQRLDHLPPDGTEIGAQAHQHSGRHSFSFPCEAEQYVLRVDEAVPELERLT